MLQDQDELALLYKIRGTPMGYLIDERGATASSLTVGAEALLKLVESGKSGASDRDVDPG